MPSNRGAPRALHRGKAEAAAAAEGLLNEAARKLDEAGEEAAGSGAGLEKSA